MQAPESRIVITCSFTVMICELVQLQARLRQLRFWKTKGPIIHIRGSKGVETIQLEHKINGVLAARQRLKIMMYEKHKQTRAQQIRAQIAAAAAHVNL